MSIQQSAKTDAKTPTAPLTADSNKENKSDVQPPPTTTTTATTSTDEVVKMGVLRNEPLGVNLAYFDKSIALPSTFDVTHMESGSAIYKADSIHSTAPMIHESCAMIQVNETAYHDNDTHIIGDHTSEDASIASSSSGSMGEANEVREAPVSTIAPFPTSMTPPASNVTPFTTSMTAPASNVTPFPSSIINLVTPGHKLTSLPEIVETPRDGLTSQQCV